MHWFDKSLIDTDAKAFGVYLALLKARFSFGWWDKESFPIPPIVDEVKQEISKFLAGKEMYEAFEALEKFLMLLHEHEAEKLRQSRTLLDEMEIKYYNSFKKACYKFYRAYKIINENVRDAIKQFLMDLKRDVIDKWDISRAGSVKLNTSIPYNPYFKIHLFKLGNEITKVYDALTTSGIVVFNNIIPAPFLEDEFIERLAPPEIREKIKAEEAEPPVIKIERAKKEKLEEKYEGKAPTREILESIVRDVLEDLGFRVETNKKLDARGGGKIEVDVWGIKLIGNTGFYVYASCRNWEREIDKSTIDEEFGRTQHLIQIPHLKIFVAKKLTDPARQTGLADGFIVIELGEKVTTNNAKEIYEIIYKHLKELFVGIAPPELQRFAKEAKEISERLKNLAEEIERISS